MKKNVAKASVIKIGIAGLGTVGTGTVKLLEQNREEITRRIGRPLEVIQIGARRDNPLCDTSAYNVTRDIFDLVKNPEIEILVELIGGTTVAKELVMLAIQAGKHIVTANKALIAEHGNELFAAAEEAGVQVLYEAGVAGGIPIIKALREGLAANKIEWLAGIINGTGNFILTEMEEKHRDFDAVLKEAQTLGYAEADPTFDVEGVDAAHKLAILASIAYGIPLQLESLSIEGITHITQADIQYAGELGYRIKHLGIARLGDNGVELRVHSTLIPKGSLLANVNGVMNAVMVKGNAVGPTLYYGAGAGADPTASAVVADIIDAARSIGVGMDFHLPPLGFRETSDLQVLPPEEVETCYFLRIQVQDQTGVLAQITHIFSELNISIDAILQKEAHSNSGFVPIIILTQKVKEKIMTEAVRQVESLPENRQPIMLLRLELLDLEGVQ